MPLSPEDSLKQYYNQFTDRAEFAAVLDLEAADPVMQGLTKSQIGQVINKTIGAAPGSKFEMFDSNTRWIDAAGYYSRELFTGAPTTPSNYMAQMRGESTRDWGDVGSDVGGFVGKAVGAEGEDLEYWKQAGEGMPAGLGTLAFAAIPVVGIPAMTGAAYGGAVNEAKSQGASSGQAAAVGALDAAVNLLFLKAGGPISDSIAGKVLGKTMGVGARDALAESAGLATQAGVKIHGRALAELAVKEGAITTKQGFANRLITEGLTEAVQSAAGVAGQVAHEGILDFESLKQNMLNPHYWATTLASEGVFAVMGTTMGQIRKPNHLSEYSAIESADVPLFNTSGSNLEDIKVVDDSKAEATVKAESDLKENLTAKSGPEAKAPLAEDSAAAIKTVGDALVATNQVGLNENVAQAAAAAIDGGGRSLVESLLDEALVATSFDKPASLVDTTTNFRVAHNRIELDIEGSDTPLVFNSEQLHQSRENFANAYTDPKQQQIALGIWDDYDTRISQELADPEHRLPSYMSPERQLGYRGFLESSGLGEAAKLAKVKLVFTDTRKSKDWFEAFNSNVNASANRLETSDGTIIHINAPSDERLSDMHEIGHAMDYVLDKGGYGEDFRAEWQRLKETWAPILAKGDNILSTHTSLEIQKADGVKSIGGRPIAEVVPSDLRKYYGTVEEWVAQGWQSYMLDNKQTKFKDFMQTHFPKLNELFARVVKSLRTVISKSKGDVSKADKDAAWAPGTREVKTFFESLMNSVDAGNVDTEIRKLVVKHKIPAKATESIIEALTESNTLAAKPLVIEAIKTWAADPHRVEVDLLSSLELVNLVNKSGMLHSDLMSPSVKGMPNVNRILNGVTKDTVVADMLTRTEGRTAEERARVEEYVGAVERFETHRALQAVDAVLSNKVRMLEESVSQQTLAEKAMLMMRVDSVVGKWFRGELPGQNGRFMWEPRFKDKGFGEIDATAEKDIRGPVELREYNEILLSKQFPTLSKAVKAIKTSAKEEGIVPDIKSGKNRIFADKTEADEYANVKNSDGGNYGYSYAAIPIVRKVKTGGQEITGYNVRFRKDGRKTIVAGLREDLTSTIDALHSLDDDPETKNYVTENAMSLLAKNYNDNIEHHVIRVTKKIFEDYRNGKKEVFPKQMLDAIKDFYKYLGQKQRPYYEALVKELGVPTNRLDDVLLGLVRKSQMSVKDKNDLIVHMDPEVSNLVENYKNYMKVWLENDFQANVQHTLKGGVPYVHNDRKVWRNFEQGMSPLEDRNFQQQVSVMQHAMPGGILRKNAAGITYAGMSPRTLLGKTVSVIEQLFIRSYGGAQTIGEAIPLLKPLAMAIDRENPNQDYMGNRVLRNLRGKMKEMKDAQGNVVGLEVDDGPEVKDDRVHIAINGSQKMKPIANRIKLMENEAGRIRFEDIANNNLAVGLGSATGNTPAKPSDVVRRMELAQEAADLIQKNFDTNNPKHMQELKDLKEFLERSYAAQREVAKITYEQELKLLHTSTAYAIFRGVDYRGTPEEAKAFAGRLQSIDFSQSNAKGVFAKMLVDPVDQGGLGWDMLRAGSFTDKWIDNVVAIKGLRDAMLSTPGYTKEQRLRRWHVSGVKRKSNSTDVTTGLWDFDTQEEALQFMKDAHKEGITVSDKHPRDQHAKNAKLRSGTDMLDEVVSRVANTRQALLGMVLDDFVLKGSMTQDERDNVVKVLSGMSEDITADMSTNRLQNVIGSHRLFKAGRDELDMSFQQEESSWRMAIQYARKQTDAEFQLFLDDPRLAPYDYERTRMITAKDSLRTADGKGQRIASKTAFTYFILGNISSAIIEAAQWPLSLSHILVEEGAGILDAFRTPGRKSAKAARASVKRLFGKSDAPIWDKEEFALIQYAEFHNRLGVRPLNDISTTSYEVKRDAALAAINPGAYKGFGPKTAYYADAAYQTMNHFYAFFSRINAEISLTSAYDVLKKSKYPNRKPNASEQMELFEAAIRVSNKANGSWGRGNRPWWFDTKSTTGRTAAQLAWSLQGFASNHVANHLRLVKHAINSPELGRTKEEATQSRKALALMTTMQVAGLGVMGHTLAGGISKLLTATFGYDPETELKDWLEDETALTPEDRMALGDLISYGGLHALGIPADVRSRMSVSGLGPVSSYDGFNAANFGGPVLSTLGALVDGWNTVSKGDGSVESFMRWGTGMAPTGVQRALRQSLFDDGKVFSKSGQFIMDPTTGEKISAYLGFASQRYSDYMRAKSKNIEANVADGRETSRAVSQIYQLLNEGQQGDAMQLLHTEAKRLNKTPQQLASAVAEFNVKRTHGPGELGGRGPNAQRATRLYQSPLPVVSDGQKKQTKFATLAKLNQLPIDWQQQMFRSAMLDTGKELTGGSTFEVKTNMKNPLFKSTVLTALQQQSSPSSGGLGQLSGGLYP